MIVTCKHCQYPQEYKPGASKSGRHRKKCVACGRRFDIAEDQPKPPRRSGSWQEKLDSKDPRLDYLDELDTQILLLIGDGWSQGDIGKLVGLSRSGIWWRIKQLKDLHVIEIIDHTCPRGYKLLPEVINNEGSIPLVLIHDVGMRMNILATGPRYDGEKLFLAAKFMKNWWQRSFDHRFVHFDVNETNTPNLFFHVTGAGKTMDDAINNAVGKALEARDIAESMLDIVLDDPRVDTGKSDIVTLFASKEQFETLGKVWNDRSDPAALFEGKLQQTNADKVVEILESHGKIEQQMTDLQADVEQLKVTGPPVGTIGPAMQDIQDRLQGLEQATTAVAAAILQINNTLLAQGELQKALKESLEHLASAAF
jgi:biotin operon repressor